MKKKKNLFCNADIYESVQNTEVKKITYCMQVWADSVWKMKLFICNKVYNQNISVSF